LAEFEGTLERAEKAGWQPIDTLFTLSNSALDQCPDSGFREGYTRLQRKAVQILSERIAADPDNVDHLSRRVKLLGQLEDKARLADVDRLIELEPDNAEHWRMRGLVQSALKSYDAAIRDLSRAIELDPVNAEIWRCRAFVHYNARNYVAGLADSNRAIELDPGEGGCLETRGTILFELNKNEEALADFNRAIELGRNCWGWRSLVYIKLEIFDEALADINRCLEDAPNDDLMWRLRGYVHRKLGNLERASLDLDHSAELSSKPVVELLIVRARFLQSIGKSDDALVDFDHCIQLDPANAKAIYNRASVHDALKNHDRSMADLDRAIELDPNAFYFLHTRAEIQLSLGNVDESIADFDRVIALNSPTPSLLLHLRGRTHLLAGNIENAQADFKRASEIGPILPQWWYERALAESTLEDETAYRTTCGRMLKLFQDSGDPRATRWLVWSCAIRPDAVDDLDRCVALAKDAAEKLPQDGRVVSSLGAILYRAGQFAEAAKCLEKPEASWGNGPEYEQYSSAYVWFFLAMAQHQLGESAAAENWMSKAVAQADQELSQESIFWNRKLTLQLLRDEATMLIRGAGKQPPNKVPAEQQHTDSPPTSAIDE